MSNINKFIYLHSYIYDSLNISTVSSKASNYDKIEILKKCDVYIQVLISYFMNKYAMLEKNKNNKDHIETSSKQILLQETRLML